MATYVTPTTTSSADATSTPGATPKAAPGVTKCVTYADVMLGRGTRLGGYVIQPGDVGLTLIPTGEWTGKVLILAL